MTSRGCKTQKSVGVGNHVHRHRCYHVENSRIPPGVRKQPTHSQFATGKASSKIWSLMWTPPHTNTSNEHSPDAVFLPGLLEFWQHFCFQQHTRWLFTVFNFFRIPLPFIWVELSTANLQGALCLHRGTNSPPFNKGQLAPLLGISPSSLASSDSTPQSPTGTGRSLWGSFWVTEALHLPTASPSRCTQPPTHLTFSVTWSRGDIRASPADPAF